MKRAIDPIAEASITCKSFLDLAKRINESGKEISADHTGVEVDTVDAGVLTVLFGLGVLRVIHWTQNMGVISPNLYQCRPLGFSFVRES